MFIKMAVLHWINWAITKVLSGTLISSVSEFHQFKGAKDQIVKTAKLSYGTFWTLATSLARAEKADHPSPPHIFFKPFLSSFVLLFLPCSKTEGGGGRSSTQSYIYVWGCLAFEFPLICSQMSPNLLPQQKRVVFSKLNVSNFTLHTKRVCLFYCTHHHSPISQGGYT